MRGRQARLLLLYMLVIVAFSSGGRAAPPVDSNGLYKDAFLVPFLDTHTAAIKQIDTDAAGKFLVTGSDDKSIRVWSQANGRMLQIIRVAAGPGFTGRVYALALSPDGAVIAASGFTGANASGSHIYLFDRATGRQTGLIGGVSGIVNQLAFSPDGKKLAAVLSGSHGVRLFDVRSRRQIGSDTNYGDSSYGVAFDRNGRVATTAFDGKIRLYSPDLHILHVTVALGGGKPLKVAFQPKGRLLALGYFGAPRVELLDSATLAPIQVAESIGVDNGDLAEVAWSLDGARLYGAGSWQRNGQMGVRAWSENGRRILTDYTVAENTITGLRALPDGTLAVASGDPRVTLLDGNGAKIWVNDPQMAEYRDQQASFAVSPDGAKVQFYFDIRRSVPARLDLHQRQLNLDPSPDPELHPPITSGLHAVRLNTTAPTLDGKLLALDPLDKSRAIAAAPNGDGFILGTEWSLRRFAQDGTERWHIPTPGVAWAVNIPSNGRFVIAAFSDGTIRWYRLTDGAPLLAFFPERAGKRWVVWNPSGYYMASPGGEELIQWQVNHGLSIVPEIVSAARFRSLFYRPDVVEQTLAALDPAKALTVADKQAGQKTVIQDIAGKTPPRVTIIEPADNTVIDSDDIVVAYAVDDRPGTKIREIRLMEDGRLIATQRNLEVPDSGQLSTKVQGRLSESTELLTLFAESNNGPSDPAKVQIKRKRPASVKSDLHVLAIGVGHFKNNAVRTLDYAGKDAAVFASRMKAQQGGLYRLVFVHTLLESEATKDAITKALSQLDRAMQHRDVAVIFISTHGYNDVVGNFFLFPYDVGSPNDHDIRHTGVPYLSVQPTVQSLASRGKAIVFLDTCYSGNVSAVDGVAADLGSSENGAIVFSSSTGSQLSLEHRDVGHGVFTYALLEALKGKAPSREPRLLHVTDLNTWLDREVRRLTHQQQTPQTTFPRRRLIDPAIFWVSD